MLIAAAGLILGAALTLVGLRGRRTDDHPLCRRCRFDLTGRPSDAERRCPECGADLDRPRAVVVGHRRRRAGVLGGGLSLLLIAAAGGAVMGYAWEQQVNWWRFAPLSYLLRSAALTDPGWRSAAWAELADRSGRLDPAQWDAAAAAATAFDADPQQAWESRWATLLQPTPGRGRPSAEAWGRYVYELARQATSPYPGRRAAALAELVARLADGSVRPPAYARIIAVGLDYQGDGARSWEPDWGTLLEQAHSSGRLTDAQWARYLRQAAPSTMFGLRLRPRVRRGDPVPYRLDEMGGRAAGESKLRLRIDDPRLVWDGRSLPPHTGSHSSSTGGLSGGGSTGSAVYPPDVPTGLSDGTQHVHLVAGASLHVAASDGSVDENSPPLLAWQIDQPGTFDLVPADRPTVTMVHDPALADAVRRSLAVRSIEQRGTDYPYVSVDVAIEGPPVGMAYRIVLVGGGREVPGGTVALPAGSGSHQFGTGGQGRASGATVDVVFRPDPAVAAATVDTFAVWDGEVVVKGMAVEHR